MIMLLASMYHIKHKEYGMLKITLSFLVLALFVLCGRRERIDYLYS